MCLGILSHKGSASVGGRTITRPGDLQQPSSGANWTLWEDAARFQRTAEGGVLTCAPVVYLDEEPPEFNPLGPGSIPLNAAGEVLYQS